MTILLNPVFLLIIGVFALLVISVYSTRNRATRNEELGLESLEHELRNYRLEELQVAYDLVKQELRHEPTIDEILLTRDTLRGDDDVED